MSKQSRERARQNRQAGLPRSFVITGIVAVLAVAGLTVRTLMQDTAPAPGVAAGTAGTTVTSTAGGTVAVRSGKKLLFFMNPDGYPCQTQLGILNGVADSLSKVAEVVYIKTTDPSDLPKFEAYGIRGLPSLVIADDAGRELSRFSPGIQSGEAVLAALTR